MLHIESLSDGLELFKALGSDVRIELINILLENRNMSMNELAGRLHITSGALTAHIKKLESCGLVTVSADPASGHGNQKICSVNEDRILIELGAPEEPSNIYTSSIRIGHYTNYDIYPTCGLASASHLIGEVDDVRYFSHPERYDAEILWFTKGYIDYNVPNFIPAGQKITRLTFSFEISSEAPGGNNDWPSDISFYLNGTPIGSWTSPGDFNDKRGLFTPSWWFDNWNQYGLSKMLVVSKNGSFIDGLKISDTTIDDLNLDYRSSITLRFAVNEDTAHVGGLTLYGRSFGNYAEDIEASIKYAPIRK